MTPPPTCGPAWWGRPTPASRRCWARDPGNADAWAWSIAVSRALELPLPERLRRFQCLIEIEPAHWYGHEQMLIALSPAGGGDDEAMFDFARSRATACAGTHVPTLIVLAHRIRNEHQAYLEAPDDPDRPFSLTYYEPEAVTDEIWEAAQNSFWHDDYRTSLLTPIVWNKLRLRVRLGRFPPAGLEPVCTSPMPRASRNGFPTWPGPSRIRPCRY